MIDDIRCENCSYRDKQGICKLIDIRVEDHEHCIRFFKKSELGAEAMCTIALIAVVLASFAYRVVS